MFSWKSPFWLRAPSWTEKVPKVAPKWLPNDARNAPKTAKNHEKIDAKIDVDFGFLFLPFWTPLGSILDSKMGNLFVPKCHFFHIFRLGGANWAPREAKAPKWSQKGSPRTPKVPKSHQKDRPRHQNMSQKSSPTMKHGGGTGVSHWIYIYIYI